MKKSILIGSIFTVSLLVFAMFPSVVIAKTTTSHPIILKNICSEKTKIYKMLQNLRNNTGATIEIDWSAFFYIVCSMIAYFPTAVVLSIQYKLQHPFESFGILFAVLFAYFLEITWDYYP